MYKKLISGYKMAHQLHAHNTKSNFYFLVENKKSHANAWLFYAHNFYKNASIALSVFARAPRFSLATAKAACPRLTLSAEFVTNISTCCANASAEGSSVKAPASTKRRETSAKLNTEGPLKIGSCQTAGSIKLWPPLGTKLPPTNAISLAPNISNNSPMVSPTITCAFVGTVFSLRLATTNPRLTQRFATTPNRSG